VFILVTLILFIWNYFTKKNVFLVEQVIFMAFFLFCINHSFSAFCITISNGSDFTSGLNDFVEMSTQIEGSFLYLMNSLYLHQIIVFTKSIQFISLAGKNKRDDSSEKKQDVFGTIVMVVSIQFLVISMFLPIFLIAGELDPLYVLFNFYEMHHSVKILCRVLLIFVPVVNFVIFLGSLHLSVILLLYISKHTIRSLKQFDKLDKFQMEFCSNSKMHRVHSGVFGKKIRLYSVVVIIISKIRQYLDSGAVSMMGNGLLIDVMVNYVIIKMYGRIPLFLYLSIAVIAILVPIVIMAELPEAGQTLVSSTDVIKLFKGKFSRSKLHRKIVHSLIPAKIVIGPFFKVDKGTTATYVNTILSFTVTTILSY